LGGLISAPVAASVAAEPAMSANVVSTSDQRPPPSLPARDHAMKPPTDLLATKTSARRGRPPGRRTGTTPHKEKVTLRVDAGLIEQYREWSWSERCQLGELVERALANYRRSCA